MNNNQGGAELPGELLHEILNNTDAVAETISDLLSVNQDQLARWAQKLHEDGLIRDINQADKSPASVMAVDGSCISEKMTAADLLIAVAVGVEGATPKMTPQIELMGNQYHAWSRVLSHEEYNTKLLQGVMHLMEMIILSDSENQIVIMDGSHITPIIKINSLLSAKEEGAGEEYVQALREFLKTKFNRIIPDIPDIFRRVFTDKRIISITKYNSSKDFIDGVAHLSGETKLDDKAFFSLVLRTNQYTCPQSFAQSKLERERWDAIHIICNLRVPEADQLNHQFKSILRPISTKGNQASSLYYLYFKPVEKIAYRIEIKEELAKDQAALENMLYNLKWQTAFPFMIEPLPQFMADNMAKQVALTKEALQSSIMHSKKLKLDKTNIHLLNSYRS